MTIGIYRLCFEGTSNCYVGQSVNIERRYTQHINTLKNSTASKKLLKAYQIYGFPKLQIVIECAISELDDIEKEAIEIFDSVNNGFNIYIDANEAPVAKGVEAGNAKYTREQLLKVYYYLANTSLDLKEVSNLTNIPISTVYSLSTGKSHQWLREELPDWWLKIQNNKSIREKLDRLKKAEFCKSNLSAKAQGIIYPIILSPNNIEHRVDCVQEFARNHSISKSSLHRILTKQVKSCKGWRLKEYE
jgi:group I intron endonuclease